MIKGFRDFLMRGNVVDLAVAVVVGGAFAKVVDTFISSIISPLLAAAGNPKSPGLGFYIRSGVQESFVNIGEILNALIVFVLTAAVVYFLVVVPMNRLMALRRKGQEAAPESPSEEVLILTQIRDLLGGADTTVVGPPGDGPPAAPQSPRA